MAGARHILTVVCLALCVAGNADAGLAATLTVASSPVGRPKSADLHARALAALARARTSSDPTDTARATALVQQALTSAPNDPRSWTLKAWDQMNAHRFRDAAASIERAHKLGPPSTISLGLQSDALVELGRYEDALAAVQTMLDLSPELPALSRAAHLRFLYGDTAGAIALLENSPALASSDAFSRGWVLLQLGELYLNDDRFADAQRSAQAARRLVPRSPEPPAMLARVHEAQGERREALALYRQTVELQPSPDYVLEAWRCARKLGDKAETARLQRLLDGLARLDRAKGELYRRAFIEYHGESDSRRAEAERLARRELSDRPDIYSHALLAWALERAGKLDEARQHEREASRLGTRDRRLAALLQPAGIAQEATR